MNKNNFKLSLSLAIQGLRTNKLRSILTTIGIIIGIATIIIVLAAGRGLKTFVLKQLETFGADTIEIEIKVPSTSDLEMAATMLGGAEVTTLKKEDFEAINKLPNISDFHCGILGQFKSVYKNKDKRTFVLAITDGMPRVEKDFEMQKGRFFTEKEEKSMARVAILGSEIKEDLFGNENAIGKTIKINQTSFKIIGVAKPRGMVFFMNYDKMVYLPLKTAQKLLLGIDHVLYGLVIMKDPKKVDETVEEIRSLLRKRHNIQGNNIDKDDFRVTSMQEALEIINTVMFAITLLIFAVAAISLIVGGVGIMNIMYLTVLERTREIGLRKAIGAPNKLIQKQFLYEAIIITIVGGIIGIIIGWILVTLIEFGAAMNGFEFDLKVTFDAILIGIISSLIFGVVFGMYPARKAANLNPVDALRWE
jgi:putative ABC transport system permease protein